MNSRAFRHLTCNMSERYLPEAIRRARESRSWQALRTSKTRLASYSLFEDLHRRPLSTFEIRTQLLAAVAGLRAELRRRKRCGHTAKYGGRLIAALRHAIEELPDPARLDGLQRLEFDNDRLVRDRPPSPVPGRRQAPLPHVRAA